jgi:hypothetical protein
MVARRGACQSARVGNTGVDGARDGFGFGLMRRALRLRDRGRFVAGDLGRLRSAVSRLLEGWARSNERELESGIGNWGGCVQ